MRGWNTATLLFMLLVSQTSAAYQIDVIAVKGSQSNIDHSVTVVLPETYSTQQRYDVIYVLHGYTGNHRNWTDKTDIAQYADKLDVMLVMPDGNRGSWYLDSPMIPDSQYATYIGLDVPAVIDQRYSTHAARSGRAITGLSMGGFGAFHLALTYPNQFSAIGSMSGGVDIRPSADKFALKRILGSIKQHPERFEKLTISNRLDALKQHRFGVIFDVGVDDFFLQINRDLHHAMIKSDIDHIYKEAPGGHSWTYWNNAIGEQLRFLSKHLKTKVRKHQQALLSK